MMERKPRKFNLVYGGRDLNVGPISRMGLWSRFEPMPKFYWMIFLGSKLVLIGSLFYFLFGR
jgi:hypothetical protein